MSKKAMELALLALKTATAVNDRDVRLQAESIVALKEALAEDSVRSQPPYLFQRYVDGIRRAEDVIVERANTLTAAVMVAAKICPRTNQTSAPTVLVYAAPNAQCKPLTDEQMWQIWNSQGDDAMEQQSAIAFARAIEAAHGIKDEK